MALPAYDDEAAWAGHSIDGRWLAQLLADGTPANGRGLRLRGARILGGLTLDGVELAGRLELVDCQLGAHPIRLRDARTRTVRLQGVHSGGIDARRAHVRGALLLQDARVHGEVRLVDARVDASVECDGAHFGLGDVALDADRAQIGGSLALHAGFAATGIVSLQAASLGGALAATGARMENPGGVALFANDADISGAVYLNDGFTATGMVRMQGARVNGGVSLAGGRFANPGDDAIQFHGSRLGGSLILRGATVEGGTRLINVEIGGDLACRQARLTHPDATVLDASRAKVTGHAFLDDGFTAEGEVRLTGATVAGRMQLSGATLACRAGPALQADGVTVGESLLLDGGFTATGILRLVGARIGADINCNGAHIQADLAGPPCLDLLGAQVGGSLWLRDGFVADGGVQIARASFGQVDCRGGVLRKPDGYALSAGGARIAGGLFLTGGFRAEGQVRLPGTTIGRDFYAAGGTVVNAGGAALHLTRAHITGDVVLGEGFAASGRVSLVRAVVGGKLDFSGGTFTHEGGPAVDLPYAQVSGAVLFDGDTTITGQVQLRGAAITGNLSFGAGRVSNAAGPAISATNARITGSVSLRGVVDGGVRLKGVSIGGDLDCRGAQLRGTATRPALAADRSRISGGLLLSNGFRADGEVRIRSSEVNGHATCRDATFVNVDGTALNFAGTRFTGDLVLDQGYRAEGTTGLGNTTIGNDLDCTGGQFSNPDGRALYVVGAHIGGSVNLDRGFTAGGLVTLAAATVGGDVRGDGGQIAGGLDATGTRIAGTLSLRDGFHCSAAVLLRGATAGTLHDDAGSWPEMVDLDGFRYERLVCPDADRGWRARSRWLRRQLTPSALGYVQLAAVYRASGDELWARRILTERYNALLRPPVHWRRQLPRGPLDRAWKLWRWVLRFTTGHGFAPGRSLLIALPLAVALTAWLAHARHEDMLVATDDTVAAVGEVPQSSVCDDHYPCVQPFVYALDNLVPIVDLGQRSRWAPDQSHRGASWLDDGRWLAAATWATSTLGWVLATLVAASFTQTVRRD